MQILQLLLTQFNLPGQLLFSGFHTGIVLVELRRILLGGENRGEGNLDFRHILIVKVLHNHPFLTLLDAVQIGGENIAQLAQPFPVHTFQSLFFLNGKLLGQPLTEVLHGFSYCLAFLPHGVLPVAYSVKTIQQFSKGIHTGAVSVLANGAEGELLGCTVCCGIQIGSRVTQMRIKEQLQLFCHSGNVHILHPGIGIAGSKERRLPTNQGGQTAKGVHQPVS